MLKNIILALCAILLGPLIPGQCFAAAPYTVVGSENVTTVGRPIAVPSTVPIVVTLFEDQKFEDFLGKPFAYSPPAGNQKWAKIVLRAHFDCSKGQQFDRTCSLFIGNVNMFFGTTAEPDKKLGPSWSIERDLTDYASLLSSTQSAMVTLGNRVDDKYTGILSGSAEIDFYPASSSDIVSNPPNLILPLNNSNAPYPLVETKSSLTKAIVFPTNVVRLYMDVFAESQGNDEFWYTNLPDDVAATLGGDGGTSFREIEISIDGRPAGVAPIFPWIYTGGIDPSLWMPIPGVQTTCFLPYRVNLTPFAGLLDDGLPHTISVSVYNVRDNFATAAALLVYTDPHLAKVEGALIRDTLSIIPRPSVTIAVPKVRSTTQNGPISVTSNREFKISGYVITSKERVETTIQQSSTFDNYQWFTDLPNLQQQRIAQNTLTVATITTRVGKLREIQRDIYRYRLDLNSQQVQAAKTNGTQSTKVQQIYSVSRTTKDGDGKWSWAGELNTVRPAANVFVNSKGRPVKFGGSSSVQRSVYRDSNGTNYDQTIKATNGKIVSIN